MENEELLQALARTFNAGKGKRLSQQDFNAVKIILAAGYSSRGAAKQANLSENTVKRIDKVSTFEDYQVLQRESNNKTNSRRYKKPKEAPKKPSKITQGLFDVVKEELYRGEIYKDIAREQHVSFSVISSIAQAHSLDEARILQEAVYKKISDTIINKTEQRLDEKKALFEAQQIIHTQQLTERAPTTDEELDKIKSELDDARKALDVAIARFIAAEVQTRLKAQREPTLSEQANKILDNE